MTYDQAATTFKISRASVARIVKEGKRKRDDPPPQPKKRGRKSELTPDALIFLLLQLEDESTLTLKEMVEILRKDLDITTSTSALDRAFNAMEITWKNVLPIPFNWNSPEVILKRQQFAQEITRYSLRHRIYIDESGFHMLIKKSKGRALAGEPAKLGTNPKGKRISLIAALSEHGYAHYELFNHLGDKKRGVQADDFRSFLYNLAPKIPCDSLLILDNCKIHHAELLDEAWRVLKNTYGIDHIFLPPYSPFLNPIELSFNVLKADVASKEFMNRDELLTAIRRSIPAVVTEENSRAWFQHCVQFYQQIGIGLPFTGKILNPILVGHQPASTSSAIVPTPSASVAA
eukprot:TRINITY_DN3246_c0_g1_i3.p1 TRINITY_DN3246_c0_g1~~TRINITY_DN3246_c0_g1_i3.p1  ORF type:complete len:346 (-),score=65.70 TRINITY_DN3246_c0_g1_i3:52-1089(-)